MRRPSGGLATHQLCNGVDAANDQYNDDICQDALEQHGQYTEHHVDWGQMEVLYI